MSYNDIRRELSESSESDVQPQQNQFTITSNPAEKNVPVVRHKKYNESSESDISSLSEDEEDEERFRNVRLQNNKRTIDVNNSDESQDEDSEESSGIYIIEQRIKRLEVDLSTKIEKQKMISSSKPEEVKPSANILRPQLFSNPPMPPPQKMEVNNKVQIGSKQSESIPLCSHSQNLNKMNILHKDTHLCMKETTKSRHKQEEAIADERNLILGQSPKKKVEKNIQEEKSSPNAHKHRISSKPSKSKQEGNTVSLLNKAHRQIDQMQKVIEDLRKENENLKDQVNKSKKKQPTEELSKLRKLSSGGDLKLEKQIQTLKAIESLQEKLKKSIAKKMKNQRIPSKNPGVANQL